MRVQAGERREPAVPRAPRRAAVSHGLCSSHARVGTITAPQRAPGHTLAVHTQGAVHTRVLACCHMCMRAAACAQRSVSLHTPKQRVHACRGVHACHRVSQPCGGHRQPPPLPSLWRRRAPQHRQHPWVPPAAAGPGTRALDVVGAGRCAGLVQVTGTGTGTRRWLRAAAAAPQGRRATTATPPAPPPPPRPPPGPRSVGTGDAEGAAAPTPRPRGGPHVPTGAPRPHRRPHTGVFSAAAAGATPASGPGRRGPGRHR